MKYLKGKEFGRMVFNTLKRRKSSLVIGLTAKAIQVTWNGIIATCFGMKQEKILSGFINGKKM